MTFFTPGTGGLLISGDSAGRTLADIMTSTSVTPGIRATRSRARLRIVSREPEAGVNNSIVNATRPSSIRTAFTY